MKRLTRWMCAAAALLLLSGPALAQQQDEQQPRAQEQAQPQDQAQDQACPRDDSQAAGAQAQPQEQQRAEGQQQQQQRDQIATGPGFREVDGNVAEVSPLVKNLTVVDPDTGRLITLDIEDDTRIVKGEDTIALDNIREGNEVRASYVLREGEFVAQRIEVSEKGSKAAEIVKEGTGEVPPTLQLQGRITETSDLFDNFRIVDPERNLAVTIDVDRNTAIVFNGRRVTFDTLELGQEVRTTYQPRDDELLAQRIEILRSAELGPGQQQGQQQQQQQPSQQQPSQQQPSQQQPSQQQPPSPSEPQQQ